MLITPLYSPRYWVLISILKNKPLGAKLWLPRLFVAKLLLAVPVAAQGTSRGCRSLPGPPLRLPAAAGGEMGRGSHIPGPKPCTRVHSDAVPSPGAVPQGKVLLKMMTWDR